MVFETCLLHGERTSFPTRRSSDLSHNVQRYITDDGYVQNEGNLEFTPGGPYVISYRSLTPRRNECTNLLVCCNGVSSSHIAFGSIRMEPRSEEHTSELQSRGHLVCR